MEEKCPSNLIDLHWSQKNLLLPNIQLTAEKSNWEASIATQDMYKCLLKG